MAYYSFIGEFTVSFEADRSERSEEWYCLFLKKVDTIIRSLRLLERAASGTREAPYPYSKKCELCELCELLERKIPPLCDGIYLFLLSRIFGILRSLF